MQSKTLMFMLVAAVVVLVGTIAVEAGPCSYLPETSDFEGDQDTCSMCCKDAGYLMGRMGSKCSCMLGWKKSKN